MKIMKFSSITILLFVSLISFNALALVTDYLDKAIKHTEAAISSPTEDGIIENAIIAIAHANAAKKHDKQVDAKHIDSALMSLDEAIKEGKSKKLQAAHNEARKAFQYFKVAKPYTSN